MQKSKTISPQEIAECLEKEIAIFALMLEGIDALIERRRRKAIRGEHDLVERFRTPIANRLEILITEYVRYTDDGEVRRIEVV